MNWSLFNLSRSIAFVILVLPLCGCEVRSLYGIELLDFENGQPRQEMVVGDAALHLYVSNSLEAPAIVFTALPVDFPAEPNWNWDEFQLLPESEKAARFGSYYDQKYLDLEITHSSTCTLSIEHFDHREDAQEVAYGRWLHGMATDDVWHSAKGTAVIAPIANCDQRTSNSPGAIEELQLAIDRGSATDTLDATVRFRVYLIDTSLHWTF